MWPFLGGWLRITLITSATDCRVSGAIMCFSQLVFCGKVSDSFNLKQQKEGADPFLSHDHHLSRVILWLGYKKGSYGDETITPVAHPLRTIIIVYLLG